MNSFRVVPLFMYTPPTSGVRGTNMNDSQINNAFFVSVTAVATCVVLDGIGHYIVVPALMSGGLPAMTSAMMWPGL